MNKEKRIPTIIGLLFLTFTIFVGVFATRQYLGTGAKASGDCEPINPQITNITNKSAAVSFSTSDNCLASLVIGGQTLDDYQSKGKQHYFQVYDLPPNTSISFTIVSNGQKINKSSYVIKTGSQPASLTTEAKLAWGRVVTADKKPAKNVIVYLNIPGALPLSAYTTTDGNWNIPLANSFNESKNDWFSLPTSPVSEDLIAISEENIVTQLTNTTDQNNPVPDITVGQDYFSNAPVVAPANFGVLPTVNQLTISKNIDISNPKENENLSTGLPDFFGVAPINSQIIITVHSTTEITGQSQSDSAGSWHWSPTQQLEPGEHTITAKVLDPATGVWQTITRNFIVQAADNSQIAFTASASATLAPTPTSAPPTLVPTIRVSHPSTISGWPQSGVSFPTTFMFVSAAILFFVSLSLFK